MDLILGDPYSWPHPIKLIGTSIGKLDQVIQQRVTDKKMKYVAGFFLWLVIVGGTGLVTTILLVISYQINFWFGSIVAVYLSYTTLAIKSLRVEAEKIVTVLQSGSLVAARQQVGMIVGRETSDLTESEICQATIETLAENTNDGVIAPLLYLAIGGPVLGMMYKAVNTLDSMVGYKNSTHLEVGATSAILDDVFSFIPARITWGLMVFVSFLFGYRGTEALRIGWRDRYQHKSPNSGFPEAVVAGALGIQLGGTHRYHGVDVVKPTIGDDTRAVEKNDINKTIRLLYGTSTLALIVVCGVKWLWF